MIRNLFMLAVASSLMSPTCRAESLSANDFDDTESAHNFFSTHIVRSCPECTTFVIVVSESQLSDELRKSIRLISRSISGERFHEAAVIRRNEVLLKQNLDELKGLKCKTPSISDKNILYFVIRKEQRCIRVSYDEETTLRVALEKIYSSISEPDIVARDISGLPLEEKIDRLTRAIMRNLGSISDQLGPLVKTVVEHHLTTAKVSKE